MIPLISMPKLLSDVEGKIKHILIASPEVMDIPRVRYIVEAFDRDVAITVVYPGTPEDDAPTHFGSKAKRLFHRGLSHLEQLASELPGGRDITYLPSPNKPWMWVQDLIHVQEGNAIAPSRHSVALPTPSGRESQQNIADIVNNPFWEKHGFTINPNSANLYSTDGGDLIVMGNTVFVGGDILAKHLHYGMNVNVNRKVPSSAYERARSYVFSKLKTIDSERNYRVIDVGGQSLGHHLDIVFTPIDENTVVVSDIKSTLEYLNIPPQIRPVPTHQRLVSQLEEFAKRLKRKYENVVRVPLVPRLYIPGNRIGSLRTEGDYTTASQDVFGLMTFNNVLQEQYTQNGRSIHRVYMPIYNIPEIVGLPGMDSSKFMDIQYQALNAYQSLGIEVRPILFGNIMGFDGALRCSVKVLARG